MEAASVTDVQVDAQPLNCAVSSDASLLATALVDGKLLLHSYSLEDLNSGKDGKGASITVQPRHTIDVQPGQPCRAVAFSSDGKAVFTGCSGGGIWVHDTSNGKQRAALGDAHEDDVSCLSHFNENLLASGDESGGLKLWDTRMRSQVMSCDKHTDYISSFALHNHEQCLVASSGDGTLSIHDLRKRKPRARTEDDADDELLSVVVVKNGKKLVAGTQSGVLNIYSWGYFNDCSDRFPGHPESVDAVVKFDEDTILTGSSDGAIRILNVLPNKLLGVVGEHEDMPIEHLALANDRRVLASVSHDQVVKLWDLSFLMEEEGDDGNEHDEDEDESESEEQGQDEDGQDPMPRGPGGWGALHSTADMEDLGAADEDEDEDGDDRNDDSDNDSNDDSNDDEDDEDEDEDANNQGSDDENEGRTDNGTVAGTSASKDGSNQQTALPIRKRKAAVEAAGANAFKNARQEASKHKPIGKPSSGGAEQPPGDASTSTARTLDHDAAKQREQQQQQQQQGATEASPSGQEQLGDKASAQKHRHAAGKGKAQSLQKDLDHSDGDNDNRSDDDNDSSEDEKRKKKHKREKTRWSKQDAKSNKQKQAAANFFAGLL